MCLKPFLGFEVAQASYEIVFLCLKKLFKQSLIRDAFLCSVRFFLLVAKAAGHTDTLIQVLYYTKALYMAPTII